VAVSLAFVISVFFFSHSSCEGVVVVGVVVVFSLVLVVVVEVVVIVVSALISLVLYLCRL
jgi:hypothetical protein